MLCTDCCVWICAKLDYVMNRGVRFNLPDDLLAYADTYRQTHTLASLSDVSVRVLGALRKAEFAEGQRALAAEQAARPDPLVEATGNEGLEPGDETTW